MNAFSIDGRQQSRTLSALWALVITFGCIIVLLRCFGAYWGNDDAGMAMIAHGYGIAAFGSPNIVFSNVLWGHLVRALPQVNGLDGYSIAMIGALMIAAAVTTYGLLQLNTDRWACLLLFALIFLRPTLFPQFTINAGLLTIAGVICWFVYAQKNDRGVFLLGSSLMFIGYIIRSREFLFILLVAAPLLPWRKLLDSRFAKIVLAILFSAIVIAAFIDHQAYQGKDWVLFNETIQQISPIVDFGAGALLRQNSDMLQRYGYTVNDIDLLSNWFFVDLNILDSRALKAMLAELGPLPMQNNSLPNALTGIKFLWQEELMPLVLAALLALSIRPSRRVLASWAIFLAGIFVLGLLGRPGVLHVYIPLVCLLVIAPFMLEQTSVIRQRLGMVILAVIFIPYAFQLCSEAGTAQATNERIRSDLAGFPASTVVNWAGSFPFEAAYPLLARNKANLPFRLYSLGGLTQAPYTNTFVEQQNKQALPDLLTKEPGMGFIAIRPYFDLLEKYCRERLHGNLQELSVAKYGDIEVSQRRCNATP